MHLFITTSSTNGDILVYDTTNLYGETGLFRVLQFSNQAIQGAMDLNNSSRIIFEYPRAIIHLMDENTPDFQHAFFIGHGIGTIANYYTDREITVAEINEDVVQLSRQYFGYTRDNILIGDGRVLLELQSDNKLDFIVTDAFTAKGTPKHLISREFFELCADKLHSEGAVILNLMGKGPHDSRINAIHTTLSQVFRYTASFILPGQEQQDMKNIVLIGSHTPVQYEAREMAGFQPYTAEPSYIIRD